MSMCTNDLMACDILLRWSSIKNSTLFNLTN